MLLWITGCIYLFELEFSSFPDIYPGVGLLDLTVALFLVFKAISILFSIVAAPIYIPINSVGGVPFLYILINTWAPWVTQMVKNLPAMWETWIRSLGWEDYPGEGKSYPFHYACLENPHGQRSLVCCSPSGHQELDRASKQSTTAHSLQWPYELDAFLIPMFQMSKQA